MNNLLKSRLFLGFIIIICAIIGIFSLTAGKSSVVAAAETSAVVTEHNPFFMRSPVQEEVQAGSGIYHDEMEFNDKSLRANFLTTLKLNDRPNLLVNSVRGIIAYDLGGQLPSQTFYAPILWDGCHSYPHDVQALKSLGVYDNLKYIFAPYNSMGWMVLKADTDTNGRITNITNVKQWKLSATSDNGCKGSLPSDGYVQNGLIFKAQNKYWLLSRYASKPNTPSGKGKLQIVDFGNGTDVPSMALAYAFGTSSNPKHYKSQLWTAIENGAKTYLYIWDGKLNGTGTDADLFIYDVSAPSSPQLVNTVSDSKLKLFANNGKQIGNKSSIAYDASNKRLYVLTGSSLTNHIYSEIASYDVTDPANPKYLSQVTAASGYYWDHIAAANGYLGATNSDMSIAQNNDVPMMQYFDVHHDTFIEIPFGRTYNKANNSQASFKNLLGWVYSKYNHIWNPSPMNSYSMDPRDLVSLSTSTGANFYRSDYVRGLWDSVSAVSGGESCNSLGAKCGEFLIDGTVKNCGTCAENQFCLPSDIATVAATGTSACVSRPNCNDNYCDVKNGEMDFCATNTYANGTEHLNGWVFANDCGNGSSGSTNPAENSGAGCKILNTLRVGSKGAEVVALQAILGIVADGNFGLKTKGAVIAYQESQGLAGDGVFGPRSRATLACGEEVGLGEECALGDRYNRLNGHLCSKTTSLESPTTAGNSTIGSKYQGGRIAYIFQAGDSGYVSGQIHGLIAASSDKTDMAWDNGKKWCQDLVLGGYDDWYLPNRDELNKLYLNKTAIGGFGSSNYWSSTEYDAQNAILQNFGSGASGAGDKLTPGYVRAVRSF